ncbi:uncharacterized protein Z518_00356 [Rhinocladiella mackenziei CBS 650.93]|uniref:Uncharacterized protein n=1 Tax=Rhinocladiella mackenziei CBS 650.93 TaxID=1442369 RepID=A0A0D2G3T3_9EURO|nr:uncharacterized protein Z518_00356 [Rhinocladiella mackenziei CBS 650.93]KIX09277.1 hypothetical protein Z518_00356 [Rhinocladiella mackenziei CBS 650.93]
MEAPADNCAEQTNSNTPSADVDKKMAASKSAQAQKPATVQLNTPPLIDQNLEPGQDEFTPTQEAVEWPPGCDPLMSPPLSSASPAPTRSRSHSQSSAASSSTLKFRSSSPSTSQSPPDRMVAVGTDVAASDLALPPAAVTHLSWTELDLVLEKIASGVEVTPEMLVHERSPFIELPDTRMPQERRLVSPSDLIQRMNYFLSYHIPGVEPEYGFGSAKVGLWNTRDPWGPVKRFSYAGLLDQYPSGTQEVLLAIRNFFYDGKASFLEQNPTRLEQILASSSFRREEVRPSKKPKTRRPGAAAPRASPKPIRPEVSSRARTRRAASSNEITKQRVTGPETVSVNISPPARPSRAKTTMEHEWPKRKREEPDDEEKKPDGSRVKRKKWNDKKAKDNLSPDLFGHHIKAALTARYPGSEKDKEAKSNYQAYAEAILPDNGPDVDLRVPELNTHQHNELSRQDLGDPSGLHPREIWLSRKLDITFDTYRCQKNRLFIGLALFVQANHVRLEEEGTDKVWNFGRSQAQWVTNVDANKASDLCGSFIQWGWIIPELAPRGADKQRHVLDDYLKRFPESHRLKLMEDFAQWEEKNCSADKQTAKFPHGYVRSS